MGQLVDCRECAYVGAGEARRSSDPKVVEEVNEDQQSLDCGFDALLPTRDPRPQRRIDESGSSQQDAPGSTQTESASNSPHFAVLDLDRDTWRLWDTATEETYTLTDQHVLAAAFPHSLTIVEGCHLREQSATSVAHPFTREQLEVLQTNLMTCEKRIRTVNNRRTPRIWAEIEPKISWDDRPKDRDAEIWARWLFANPERLRCCKHWPERHIRRSPQRDTIMRDVNTARQYRAYPASPYAVEFARRVKLRLHHAWNLPWANVGDFRRYTKVAFGMGQSPTERQVLGNPYVCNAYCVAFDLTTHEPRSLSNREIKHICGLNANGYPNQIRADLRHHLGRSSKLSCTEIDRAFVKLVRALIDASGALPPIR